MLDLLHCASYTKFMEVPFYVFLDLSDHPGISPDRSHDDSTTRPPLNDVPTQHRKNHSHSTYPGRVSNILLKLINLCLYMKQNVIQQMF